MHLFSVLISYSFPSEHSCVTFTCICEISSLNFHVDLCVQCGLVCTCGRVCSFSLQPRSGGLPARLFSYASSQEAECESMRALHGSEFILLPQLLPQAIIQCVRTRACVCVCVCVSQGLGQHKWIWLEMRI